MAFWVFMVPGSEQHGEELVWENCDELQVTGQVYRKEIRSHYGQEVIVLYLKSITILDSKYSFHLICELEEGREPLLGEYVQITGQFDSFPKGTNPGEFDTAQHYKILGIEGRIKKASLIAGNHKGSFTKEGLYKLRVYWKERLYQRFPEKEASILSAMLLGDKGSLDWEVKELYRRNGIIHILSISGLHISILGIGIYYLLRKMGLSIPISALTGGGLLLLYGCMTGMAISAVRAIGMYWIRMLGECLRRTYDMVTALGIMGIIMLLQNPQYLLHSGFLLSFGSVMGIGLLAPVMEESKQIRNKLLRSITSGTAIFLFTLPIHLWFYYEIPILAIFLNLFVLPLMSVLMVCGLIVMIIPGLGFLGILCQWILSGYEWLCLLSEKVPFHTWNPGKPELWQVVVYYIALAILIIWGKYFKVKWKMVYTISLILILNISIHTGVIITFLDVGQGDCIFVRTDEGRVYLFDGGSSSKSKIGKNVILPFLKQQGIRRVDAVFISHPDSDHMNGIQELIEISEWNGITIGEIVLPEVAEEVREEDFESFIFGSIPISYIGAGSEFESGKMKVTCFHPPSGYRGEKNEYSQCFLLEYQSFSMLLTGDVEGVGEKLLIQELKKRQIEDIWILKLAHHGSRNSTTDEILQILNPKVGVISSGIHNSYGHPHTEVMDRLKQHNVLPIQTSEAGAVTVKIMKEKMIIECFNKSAAGVD